jgi:TonB family protein
MSQYRSNTRHASVCGGLALALTLVAGTAFADSPAKVDRSKANPAPEYPDLAQTNGEVGDVVIGVLVNSSGRAMKLRIDQTSGFTDLDNAAIEGAANWHYIPAIVGGDTTTSWMKVKIHFQPPEAPAQATPASATH